MVTDCLSPTRRQLLGATAALGAGAFLPWRLAAKAPGAARWVSTTQNSYWADKSGGIGLAPKGTEASVTVSPHQTFQTIEGFGACFNELGGVALNLLPRDERMAVLKDMFAPGVGMNFSVCRMPVAANDFARDWYSYNETPLDFKMTKFSVAYDREVLMPFIKSARAFQPNLRLWASPWSPPTWMKRNKHYAMRPSNPGAPSNGIRPDQIGRDDQDMFIQEPAYFEAYALYFRKFIEAYRKERIPISMVMPQNEFNSAQSFPSCCWTPEGLARFIPYLGREMDKVGVDIFFGTLERADPTMVERVLRDGAAGPYIKGVGVQWAGRGAVPYINYLHPKLPIYQTEQECGDGRNDWRYARHSWNLMKAYLGNGARVYEYWNLALQSGGVSRWGWAQNSLVTVDPKTRQLRYNPEYYVLKHVSHFVQPGAKRVSAVSWTGYENVLAFRNPDGRIVIAAQNELSTDLPINFGIDDAVYAATLPADSFNTFLI